MKALLHWLCISLLAAASAAPAADAADDLGKTLAAAFPGVKVVSVADSPLAGIVEVVTENKEVVYATRDGKYLFNGNLFDVAARRNLTAERLAALARIDFAALPLNRAIKLVRGAGTRRIAVFDDPLCPYCRQLHGELDKLRDVTVYIFPLPLPIHPGADVLAHGAWCAEDPAKAWHDMMTSGARPAPPASGCRAPLEEVTRLAVRLGVNSTPTIYLENGEQLAGAVPAGALEGRLRAAAGK